jgi:uncharacterized protein (DUF58 family)
VIGHGAAATAATPSRYLDPAVLAGVRRLELRSRLVAEGFLAGSSRSPFHGSGIEFAQHRAYSPGDEVRRIDWKVWSRTDRLSIKLAEVETNLRCVFLVDASPSMRYRPLGGGRLDKFDTAAVLACAGASLLTRTQDAPGLVTFGPTTGHLVRLPCRAHPGQAARLAQALEGLPAAGSGGAASSSTDLSAAAAAVVESLSGRGLVVVLSDLLAEPADLAKAAARFRHARHDVLWLQVLDADELRFPYQGRTRFVDLEDGAELVGDPRGLRQAYLDALDQHRQAVRAAAAAHGQQIALVDTSAHLDATLHQILHARRQRAGRAG